MKFSVDMTKSLKYLNNLEVYDTYMQTDEDLDVNDQDLQCQNRIRTSNNNRLKTHIIVK